MLWHICQTIDVIVWLKTIWQRACEHTVAISHTTTWTRQQCFAIGLLAYVMGCSYACLEVKQMLDDLICNYEMAMNSVLSLHLSAPCVLAYKSMFACVDNMCMCAYERVCVNVMYKKLDKKEADWLYACMKS